MYPPGPFLRCHMIQARVPMLVSQPANSVLNSQDIDLCRHVYRVLRSRSFSVEIGRKATTLVVSNIFPDASASAAGVRTQAIMNGLAQTTNVHLVTGASDGQEQVVFASSNSKKKNISDEPKLGPPTPQEKAMPASKIIRDLAHRNILWSHLPPNRSKEMQEISDKHPWVDKIIFDRFYNEEAYSFAFRDSYPNAALILDMQDMHSLRGSRERIVNEWDKAHPQDDPLSVLESVMNCTPSVDNPQLLREIGSIHRSDLTMVCSPFEMELLTREYGISPTKFCLAPFFVSPERILSSLPLQSPSEEMPSCPSFVFCGGFKHAPNLDALRLLLRTIWPEIRKEMPNAELHVHGAYCPSEFRSNPRLGIIIHGYSPSLDAIFRPGSILLAPLRFGAGIKGKIIDAWSFGMPVVTTPIGAEGLAPVSNPSSFGGRVAVTTRDFIDAAITLASHGHHQTECAEEGKRILLESQTIVRNWESVRGSLEAVVFDLDKRRSKDYIGAMMWHHSARSTEYFSRWIEAKETHRKK